MVSIVRVSIEGRLPRTEHAQLEFCFLGNRFSATALWLLADLLTETSAAVSDEELRIDYHNNMDRPCASFVEKHSLSLTEDNRITFQF